MNKNKIDFYKATLASKGNTWAGEPSWVTV